MKRGTFFHFVGRILAFVAGIALIGAWVAGDGGAVAGFSQGHLYYDSIALALLSISAFLCAMLYRQENI